MTPYRTLDAVMLAIMLVWASIVLGLALCHLVGL